MNRARVILLAIGALITAANAGALAQGNKKLRHQLSVNSMALHVTDPNWSGIWWRRNGIPQYQISYAGVGLKGRYFRYGPVRTRYAWRPDLGVLYFINNGPNDPSPKMNSVYMRTADIFDCLATYSVASLHGFELQAGIGGSHRKGYEDKALYITPVYLHLISEARHYNSWGLIGELSFSYTFLKYARVNLDVGYRRYPESDYALITAGLGLGVQLEHRLPKLRLRKTSQD